MRKLINFWVWSFVLCFFHANASTVNNVDLLEIRGSALFVPHNLGDIYLRHDNDGFHVVSDEKISPIHRYNVSKTLRDLTNKELLSFLNVGNLIIGSSFSTIGDDLEYNLTGSVRVMGGSKKHVAGAAAGFAGVGVALELANNAFGKFLSTGTKGAKASSTGTKGAVPPMIPSKGEGKELKNWLKAAKMPHEDQETK